MKTGFFSPGSFLLAAAGTLLLCTAAGCNPPATHPNEPQPTAQPKAPGPHNTYIVDTSATGQTDYEGLPGQTPTLVITLPSLDSQYKDPADPTHTRYKPIEDNTIVADPGQIPAPDFHNIVVFKMQPLPTGAGETDRVKSPLVIIRSWKPDATIVNQLKSGQRPVAVIDMPDCYPTPGPNAPPHLFTPAPAALASPSPTPGP